MCSDEMSRKSSNILSTAETSIIEPYLVVVDAVKSVDAGQSH